MQAIGAAHRPHQDDDDRAAWATALSRELREKVEGEVAAQAIARYRAKAADYAKQFGYGGYVRPRGQRGRRRAAAVAPAPMLRAQGHVGVGRRGAAGRAGQGRR